MASAADPEYEIDFRSTKDDAWYTARAVLNGDELTVKFKDFPETCFDEVLRAGDFVTPAAVEEVFGRFRSVTIPLEDSECRKIVEGMTVCATYKGDGTVRYFDAIVEAVQYKEHPRDNCLCSFLLFWQHGPGEGYVTSTNVADICLISPCPVCPEVIRFTNLVKENLKMISYQSDAVSCEKQLGGSLTCKKRKCSSHNEKKMDSLVPQLQEMESARRISWSVPASEGSGKKHYEQFDRDSDMGGSKDIDCCHHIIIDNVEKDLCPFSITEFIRKQTSATSRAHIFPSLPSESSTRGSIVLDSRMKYKRVYEFLCNRNQLIVSSKGRPWVITGTVSRIESFETTAGCLLPNPQHSDTGTELAVVQSGTEEYRRAYQLKKLFMEFHDHLDRLRMTLDMEEKKIMGRPQAL